MTVDKFNSVVAKGPTSELDRECETWDWARTAGVSAQDLLQAVRERLSAEEVDRPPLSSTVFRR